jgi:hypothetical protein
MTLRYATTFGALGLAACALVAGAHTAELMN